MAQGGGIGGAERGEAGPTAFGSDGWRGALGNARDLVGRWPTADAVLQGSMSEGLRDWDLWYVCTRNKLFDLQWEVLIHILGARCYFLSSLASSSRGARKTLSAHWSSRACLPCAGLARLSSLYKSSFLVGICTSQSFY